MAQARKIFDVDDWDEAIWEAKATLDADPENHLMRGYLLMLDKQKKKEKEDYSPKNKRKGRRDLNSPSAAVQLRSIVDKTLVEFSELCGIKYETYRAIERETKKSPMPPNAISRQNAELIALATGVCPQALMENRLVCADGKTEYDQYIWYTYAVAIHREHAKLEGEWLNLFVGAVKQTIRIDKDNHYNNSFLRVVRLALLIDEFQDIYDKPTERGKRRRLVSALLESTKSRIAKAAIERAAKIRKMAGRRTS